MRLRLGNVWRPAAGLLVLVTGLFGVGLLVTGPHQALSGRGRARFAADWLGPGKAAPEKGRPARQTSQVVALKPDGTPLWHTWLNKQSRDNLHGMWLGKLLGVEEEALDLHAPDKCAAALQFKKIALLFLTRGKMHHEATWALWFRAAQGLVPPGALQDGGCGAARAEAVRAACGIPQGARGRGLGPIQQQHLASVYVHVGLNDTFTDFPPDSIFRGLAIQERVLVEWGRFSLVDATKALMRAAVTDPANEKFMLMSESGVPLYPLATLWQQLVWETKSRVHACEPEDAEGEDRIHIRRWVPEMGWEGGPQRWQWRKSWQWVTLKRSHVEIALEDTQVADVFRKYCYGQWYPEWNSYRDCWSDEHYFPTLLAMKDVENETDCTGTTMHVAWRFPNDSHPASWEEEEIDADKFRSMQQSAPACDAAATVASAAQQLVRVADVAASTCVRAPPFASGLGYSCVFAARKFAPPVAQKVYDVLSSCASRLNILVADEFCGGA